VYWPWAQVIRSYLRDRDPATLSSLMGSGAADISGIVAEVGERLPGFASPPKVEPERARFHLFDNVTSFLRNASQAEPVTIILDDLHWADEASLQLLSFVARHVADSRLLLLATHRDGHARAHPEWCRIIGLLQRDAKRVDLHGLSLLETGEFLQHAAGSAFSEAIVGAMHTRTGGNPFFLDELARLVVTDEGIDPAVVTAAALSLPQNLCERIIYRSLEHLPAEGVRALSLASVIGREFRRDVIERAGQRLPLAVLTSLEVSDACAEAYSEGRTGGKDWVRTGLDAAVNQCIVSEVTAGSYRFSHVLVCEALYNKIPARFRSELHRAVAEALEEVYHTDLDRHLAQLAYHFAEAVPACGPERALAYARLGMGPFAERTAGLVEMLRGTGGDKMGRPRAAPRDRRRPASVCAGISGGTGVIESIETGKRSGGDANVFRRDGGYWIIVWNGTGVRLHDSRGVRYLAELLRQSGRPIHVADLIAVTCRHPAPAGAEVYSRMSETQLASEGLRLGLPGDAGTLLDAKARDQYRQRLGSLRDELEEADRWNDPLRARALREEIERLTDQLSAAYGLCGQLRGSAGAIERMRKTVWKAINRGVLAKLQALHPTLWGHLTKSLKTGTFCIYNPDQKPNWTF
jgi:hypothetical protein